MSEATQYTAIGKLYHVKFIDGQGYSWNHVIAVPFTADVMVALDILQRAYPGRRVRELREGDFIHHGFIGTQDYSNT